MDRPLFLSDPNDPRSDSGSIRDDPHHGLYLTSLYAKFCAYVFAVPGSAPRHRPKDRENLNKSTTTAAGTTIAFCAPSTTWLPVTIFCWAAMEADENTLLPFFPLDEQLKSHLMRALQFDLMCQSGQFIY